MPKILCCFQMYNIQRSSVSSQRTEPMRREDFASELATRVHYGPVLLRFLSTLTEDVWYHKRTTRRTGRWNREVKVCAHHLVPIKSTQGERSPTGPVSCPSTSVRAWSAQNHVLLKHNQLSLVPKVLLFAAVPEVRTSSHLLLKHSEG